MVSKPMPIFDHHHPKIIEVTFGFPEFLSTTQNQSIQLIPARDTANFRFLRLEWPLQFFAMPTTILFNRLSISINLYQHAKNRGFFHHFVQEIYFI